MFRTRYIVLLGLLLLSTASPAAGPGDEHCGSLTGRLARAFGQGVAEAWWWKRFAQAMQAARRTLPIPGGTPFPGMPFSIPGLGKQDPPVERNTLSGDKHQDPKYPKSGKRYKARNKDSESPPASAGKPPPRQSLSSVPVPGLDYWRITRYPRFEARTGILTVPPSPRHAPPEGDPAEAIPMTVNRVGEQDGEEVLIPDDYEPIRLPGVDHLVEVDDFGNVYFRGETATQVTIPVRVSRPQPLTPALVAHYTASEKLPLSEWPKWIADEVQQIHQLRKNGGISDLEIAERLESFIRKQMIYPVDKTDDEGILEMADRGRCQCDGAATIMVALLRSQFGIASEVVTGFQGAGSNKDPNISHVISPASGHAWVRMFNPEDNTWYRFDWYRFDPTPTRKSREEEKNKPQPDDEFTNNSDREGGDEKDEGGEDGKDGEKEDEDESAEDDPAKDDEHAEDSDEAEGKDSEKSASEAESESESDSQSKSTKKSSDKQGEQKKKRVKKPNNPHRPVPPKGRPRNLSNPEQRALAEALLAHALEAHVESDALISRLGDLLKTEWLAKGAPEVKKEAAAVNTLATRKPYSYRSAQDVIKQWKEAGAADEKIKAVAQAKITSRALQALSTARQLSPAELRLQSELAQILNRAVAEDLGDADIGKAVYAGTKGALSRDYLNKIARDSKGRTDWNRIGSLYRQNQLEELALMQRVGALMDLKADSRIGFTEEVKIAAGITRRKTDNERRIQPLTEAENLDRVVRDGLPPEMDLVRFLSGDLYEHVHVDEKTKTRKGKRGQGVTRVIVLDISGSMSMYHDERYRIRNAVANHYVDYAYRDPELPEDTVIIPYDGSPHPPEFIGTDRTKAAAKFESRMMRPLGTTDANNTPLALKKAFEVAKEKGGGRINIVLVTDGEETININDIVKMRADLDENAQVNFTVVTLVTGHPSLEKLAEAGRSEDGKKTFIHLTSEEIAQLLADSRNARFMKTDAEDASVELPRKAVNSLRRAAAAVDRDADERNATMLDPFEGTRSIESTTPARWGASILELLPEGNTTQQRRRIMDHFLESMSVFSGLSRFDLIRDLPPADRKRLDRWLQEGKL